MALKKLRISVGTLIVLAGASAHLEVLAQTPSPFSVIPGAAAAANQGWGDQGCGYGSYRTPGGGCDIVKSPSADCQPGTHAISAPSGRGGGPRCVPN